MSNANEPIVGEAAENLSEGFARVAAEAGGWVSDNWVDILIAASIGTVIALFLYGLRLLGARLLRRWGADPRWPAIFARALARTSIFFIVMCSIALVVEHAEAPPNILRVVHFLFVIAAVFQAAIWARELILGFVEHRVGEAEEHSALGSAVGIIRLLVSVALFAIAVILVLDNLGVNVTGLVAGLGIGGIAIGLAAQGIFSDLFAALSIIFDRPFRRGDTITFGSPPTTGIVENIGLKSTRIRSLAGEEVIVSNANLLNMQLQNFALLERRRIVMQFGIIYQTPPETIAAIQDELKAIVERQPLATFDRAHAFQFGASSIDFEFVFFIEAPGYADMMETRQAIMLAMMRRFRELHIEFAYPTQVTFNAGPDGRLVMPYPHVRMLAEPDEG